MQYSIILAALFTTKSFASIWRIRQTNTNLNFCSRHCFLIILLICKDLILIRILLLLFCSLNNCSQTDHNSLQVQLPRSHPAWLGLALVGLTAASMNPSEYRAGITENGLHPGIMGIPEQTYTTVPVYSRGSGSSHPCSRTYLQMLEQEVMQHHSRMHVLSGYCMCTQNSTDHMQ